MTDGFRPVIIYFRLFHILINFSDDSAETNEAFVDNKVAEDDAD